MNDLTKFVWRLERIGIKLSLIGNTPWIYLDTINGIKVKEKLDGNHGFTIAWYPVRVGQKLTLNKPEETFKLIRKYIRLAS